jgi:serine/threonine protein kinase
VYRSLRPIPLLSPDIYLADGTLRWQAPEVMGGANNHLTQAIDIYAFAITCFEILDKGNMPWQYLDDAAVFRLVVGM